MPDEVTRGELARQVVANIGAGLAAGYAGPLAGALATGAVPVVQAGMDYIAWKIGNRRVEHAAETLEDAADALGAEKPEDFIEFVKAALSDPERQELLARALTIAQDTAMRDKRRALGRALASAASDIGTKVDDELDFIRVLADLDPVHVRVLRIMNQRPPHLNQVARQMNAEDDPRFGRQWYPWSLQAADPGLGDSVWGALRMLEQHGLIWDRGEQLVPPPHGMQHEYEISPYGEYFLEMLAAPANQS